MGGRHKRAQTPLYFLSRSPGAERHLRLDHDQTTTRLGGQSLLCVYGAPPGRQPAAASRARAAASRHELQGLVRQGRRGRRLLRVHRSAVLRCSDGAQARGRPLPRLLRRGGGGADQELLARAHRARLPTRRARGADTHPRRHFRASEGCPLLPLPRAGGPRRGGTPGRRGLEVVPCADGALCP